MLTLFIKMQPLVFLVLAGCLFYRLRIIDAAFTRQLSLVMLNFFYPCLILGSILRNFTWESLLQNWLMPVGAIFVLLIGWAVGTVVLPLLKRQPMETRRCFHFTCLMNNYSFLPIIIATALWGEEAVALVIFSSLGSELCVWTFGVKTLTGERLGWRSMRNLASVPMCALLLACGLLAFMRLVGAAALPGAGTLAHEAGTTLLEGGRMAGDPTIPASAMVCGARIAMLHPGRLLSPLMVGASLLRLVVIPALCIGLFMLLPLPLSVRQVLVLIAVQPAAMVSVTLAEAFRSDANFAATAVLVTHLLCLVTIPLWLALCLT